MPNLKTKNMNNLGKIDKAYLYQNYDTARKSFITSIQYWSRLIREEMVQYSLDLDSNHIDFVYEMIIENFIPRILDFKKSFDKFKYPTK